MRLNRSFIPSLLIPGILFLLLLPVYPASFDIKPIKIFFDSGTKADKLTINNAGDRDLSVQLMAYKWSQSAEGDDIYKETSDIIVFPKILTIKKGEERIIRVGTKIPAGMSEKTYRLYIEEMPAAGDAPQGAAVRMLMRAGVPLFINPVKADARGTIESLSLKNGRLEIRIKNEGNVHFIIRSIHIRGKALAAEEVFSRELGGWYLLSGGSRLYSTTIPRDACIKTARLEIEVKTDRFNMGRAIEVKRDMCSASGAGQRPRSEKRR